MTIKQLRRPMGVRAENAASVVPEIEAQMAVVKEELERLGNALVGANEKPEMVLRMIAEREKLLADLEARLEEVRVSPIATITRGEGMKNAVRERLKDLHGLFARHPEAAHRAMETMLGGPLRFTAREGRDWNEGNVGDGWVEVVEGA